MNAVAQITEADERALLDSIDRWLEKKVAPVAAKYEQADEYPHELVADMCEMGLFGALIEPQWGGLGLGAVTYSRIVARISEEWMSPTGCSPRVLSSDCSFVRTTHFDGSSRKPNPLDS